MNNSSASARSAGSGLTHRFPWKWWLKDLEQVPKNGLTVFSCFSCGGGSSMGYKFAGYDVIGNCEIDPKVAAVYQANLHPKYPYLMDVRDFLKIPNEELPKELFNLDVLDGSPPCFAAGTPVKTINGYKPIEEIQVGDMVLTHKGRYRQVTATMEKYAENVVKIKAQGTLPIVCTDNHPFYVREMRRGGKKWKRDFGDPIWKQAGDLAITRNSSNAIRQQDYLAIPINTTKTLPSWNGVVYEHVIYGRSTTRKEKKSLDMESNDFWYLVGRYVGDGWCRKDRKVVTICCRKSEKNELQQIISAAKMTATCTEQITTYRFEINNSELYAFLAAFGNGAVHKCIPEFVHDLPNVQLESFLNGYLSADGSYEKSTGKRHLSTVSISLALGIQTIVAKLYGNATTLVTRDNSGHDIDGRKVKCHLAYELSFFMDNRKQVHGIVDEHCVWVPYRKTEVAEPQKVYNLSVNEDESYTVFNLAVHNCTSFSMAGDREKAWNTEKVFKEGQAKQKLDDLFFHFIAIAKKLQPKVVIAENVAGLVRGNAKGYVNEIFKAFDEAGYNTQLFLLDAARMGVPQARQRCFFVARHKELGMPEVKLEFHEKPITFGEVRTEKGRELRDGKVKRYLKYMQPTDKAVSDILERVIGESALYCTQISQDHYVATTLTSSSLSIRGCDGQSYSDGDHVNVQTFPQDYDFGGQNVRYICGMSVPPVMMAQVATQVKEQILDKVVWNHIRGT